MRKFFITIGILIWLCVLTLLISLVYSLASAADLPEYAIVSFDDAEHLLAQADSIAGVCDYDSVETKIWTDGYTGEVLRYEYNVTVTCRKNVRFQVMQRVSTHQYCEFRDVWNKSMGLIKDKHFIVTDTTKGEAIITWEEVKQ